MNEEEHFMPCTAFLPVEEMGAELAVYNAYKWVNGQKLTIHFMGGIHAAPNAAIEQKVRNYILQWQPHVNLLFEFTTDADAHIRISFDGTENKSKIGRLALSVPAGTPTLYLGEITTSTPESRIQRLALHEFGHALGCVHEHLSPLSAIPWNKTQVYNDLGGHPNYWPKDRIDNNYFNKLDSRVCNTDVFDRNSIMIYQIKPSWVTDPTHAVVPAPTKLSPEDIRFISKMYRKPEHHDRIIYGKQHSWLNTNILLNPGERCIITAYGSISFGPFGSWPFDPDGENKIAGSNSPVPGLRKNSLVARVAWESPVFIGKNGTVQAANKGYLLIATNDDWVNDNDGHWNVHIEVMFP